MSVNTFRAALVVDGEYISAWQYWMLERLLASRSVVLVGVIFRKSVTGSCLRKVNTFVLNSLQYIDGKLFKCPVTARVPSSLLPLLGDVDLCEVGSKRYQALLAGEPLDLAIDLSGQEPLPELMAASKHGVWRYFYGNPACLSDRYANIHEYADRRDEIISGVERCMVGQKIPECIFYATTSTDTVSINRGVERTLWKMADFIPQRLHELAQIGAADFSRNVRERIQPSSHPVRRYASVSPGLFITLRILWRYSNNFLRRLYNALFRNEQWILLTKTTENITDAGMPEHFHKWIPPRDRFWADPFVVEHSGEQYIFFEEMLYARGIGHLACVRLNADGSHSEPITILERPYHLSYPFVFQHQGQYYLIPETAENHTVEVYRCEEFPHRWVFEKNLMEGVEAYDATLLEHDGRWWMFASMRQHQNCSPSEALYLFHADNPLSTEWQAHPQNPVVASAARARPAGRIFRDAGNLYRPSQNCAGVYGRGLNVNLIRQLDLQTYREDVVSSYLPDGEHDMNGMHTLGIGVGISVTDAVHVHRRLGMFDRWMARLT